MPLAYAMTQNMQSDSSYQSSNTFIGPAEEIKFIPIEKARRGVVQDINDIGSKYSLFTVQLSSSTLYVESNATTTYLFGDGSKASADDINKNMKIYVFGYIKSDDSSMIASKIIIANKSVLQRK